jgi:hypothetical protein
MFTITEQQLKELKDEIKAAKRKGYSNVLTPIRVLSTLIKIAEESQEIM